MNKYRTRGNGRIFNLVKGSSSFRIKNQDTTTTSIYLYDEISYWGVTAADFIRELQGVQSDSIDLHINSPGGDVFEGLAILNSMRQHSSEINVVVDGLAASAASFIAMGGKSVTMAENSMLMIHDAFGMVLGNAADMQAMADLLNKTSDNVAGIYASKAGGTTKDWRTAMLAETWYTADEAVKAGLADSVSGTNDIQDAWDLSIYNGRKTEQKVVIPEPKKQNDFDFSGVSNLLKQAFKGE